MRITSPAFHHGGTIPQKYTCDGENINPPLVFQDVPSEAVSLVLITDDPDVPSSVREDNMWNHWVVFNIPPNTAYIKEGTEPEGAHGITTSGKLVYGGPCPPDRGHRYFFKLYALNTKLSLPEGSVKEDIVSAMKGYSIAKAELMGTYERK